MLYRGNYQIPWGCQFKPYDPYEKAIREAAGKKIAGRRGRSQDRHLFGGYDYFLFAPADASMSWTAFHSFPELQQFLDAYGLEIGWASHELNAENPPDEGTSFSVRVPASPIMAPLRHVATEALNDGTGLSLRVAKLGDEPRGNLHHPAYLARRMMAIELWDGDKQVASFSPFTIPAAPTIIADPDQLTEDDIDQALSVLVGTLPWGEQWDSFTGHRSQLVDRVAAMAAAARAAEAPIEGTPNRPRG